MSTDKKPSFAERRRAVQEAAGNIRAALEVLDYEAERLAELEKRYPERHDDK